MFLFLRTAQIAALTPFGLALCILPCPAQAEDGWVVLATARASFERGAWTADFVQTYVPAGFTSGEQETGRVSLGLPGKLRWDYDTPFSKVFLVRQDHAFTWNPGESSGRRTLLAAEEREHLALQELDVATLETRYAADVAETDTGALEVTLSPVDTTNEIRSAVLTLDRVSNRLLKVAYSDQEGNSTEFELTGHRLATDPDLFAPPPQLDWLDD